MGKTRATQLAANDGHYNNSQREDGNENVRHGNKALCIQVHGDAAIAGQVNQLSKKMRET